MTLSTTVLIPTHDQGRLLPYAVASALAQTVRDLEIFIIGDGVSPATRELITRLAASDPRVRFFAHPKHERRGEPYRHAALQEARGKIVCYLCNRDLWLPNHVEQMLTLLESADFAHTLSLYVWPGDQLHVVPSDLALPAYRRSMFFLGNRVPLSCAAHTLAMYRRLPYGWRTTPAGQFTDLYMFQQFLRVPECRAASGTQPTAATFPSLPRQGWTLDQRVEEMERWARRLADAETRQQFVVDALRESSHGRDAELVTLLEQLGDIYESPMWRLRERLLRLRGVKMIKRTIDAVRGPR
jgi:glycosyltransferase involved in cell wall biosynthesis